MFISIMLESFLWIVSLHLAIKNITLSFKSNDTFPKDIGVDSSKINGWFLESGQMTDHFHVIEFEEHLDPKIEKITRFSPIFFINEHS